MAAEVFFRGPMLFLTNKSKSDEVYVPHAEREICDDHDHLPNRHADKSTAVWHHPGLMIAQGRKILDRCSLQQKIVTISDGSGAACHYNSNGLFMMDEISRDAFSGKLSLLRDSDPSFWERVAARVHFDGGVLRDGMYTNAQFSMDAGIPAYKTPLTRPVAGHWYTTEAATLITVTDIDGTHAVPFRPTTDQQVYIYNWDKKDPTVDDLTIIPLVDAGGIKQPDTDYKWLYQLYEPLMGKTGILHAKAGGMLPAPLTMVDRSAAVPSLKEEIRSVGSAGCVAGGGGGI